MLQEYVHSNGGLYLALSPALTGYSQGVQKVFPCRKHHFWNGVQEELSLENPGNAARRLFLPVSHLKKVRPAITWLASRVCLELCLSCVGVGERECMSLSQKAFGCIPLISVYKKQGSKIDHYSVFSVNIVDTVISQ